MKKLMSLLGMAFFATAGFSPIMSCKTPLKDDNNEGVEKDIEILNKISQRAINNFSVYARTKNTINSTEYQNKFDKLYTMVNKETESKKLNQMDEDVKDALATLKNGFIAVFNNICNEIYNDYSNYYPDSKPIELLSDSLNYELTFIDMAQLKTILYRPGLEKVKAVRLDFHFQFKANFKLLSTTSDYVIQYVITDNPEEMKVVLNGMVQKISRVIVNFFNTEGVFQIDKAPEFAKIYQNFDVNYTAGFANLDKIILEKLQRKIESDSELQKFVKNIKYNSSITLLSLLTSAINNTTNGVDVVRENTASYVWTGKGYQPDKITPENFVKFYRALVNVFNTGGQNLRLADFHVNLAKIQVAGFPLSGAVMNDGQALKVQVEITEEGLTNKLMEFGRLVVAFYNHFKLESNEHSGVFHLSEEAFTEILNLKNRKYKDVLKILIDDFKEAYKGKNLPGLDIFTTGNWEKRVHEVSLNKTKDTFSLRRRAVWNFDLLFGTNNAVYYTGWTSTLFTLEFTKK
ncbi:hypothetical protein [Spiroplasma melliferum]|uniref:hypothetical protein n=1 Tax=Spiroplasma melliferum TaxID=2134 RepID=UPI000C760B97|nr:hypothetical protein [Spiroplasma melliferum]